jgi:uncharacterized protein (TIGR00369 family)
MLAKVLVAKMPVNASVHQPMGLLHGGASVALAESGKCGFSVLLMQKNKKYGIEISANHLRSIHEGVVTVLHELFTKEERICGNKITDEEGI